MALESATYISDLVNTNPVGSDNISQGDDHIRLIKATLLTTFPAVTGAVTATHTELNALDGITASVAELNYTDGVTSAIQTQLDAKAPLASPTFTGTPAAPTAGGGTNTTQVATTAFVQQELASSATGNFLPLAGGTMTGQIIGSASTTARATLRVPHGTAPASPTNGDVWTTTSGLYARINGSTVGYGSGAGTVTSVAASVPSALLTVSGSPVTSSGTLAVSLASQTQNKVFASPNGSTGTPSFRVMVADDLPATMNDVAFDGVVSITNTGTNDQVVTFGGSLGSMHILSGTDQATITLSSGAMLFETENANFLFADYGAVRYFNITPSYIFPQTDGAMDLGQASKQFEDCYLVNAPTVSSDRRLKQDIAPLEIGLSFINALEPVSYRLIGGRRIHTGLIAQNVQASIPKGVDWAGHVLEDPSNPDSKQALRYDELIAPLIRAVQELSAEVAALKAAAKQWG